LGFGYFANDAVIKVVEFTYLEFDGNSCLSNDRGGVKSHVIEIFLLPPYSVSGGKDLRAYILVGFRRYCSHGTYWITNVMQPKPCRRIRRYASHVHAKEDVRQIIAEKIKKEEKRKGNEQILSLQSKESMLMRWSWPDFFGRSYPFLAFCIQNRAWRAWALRTEAYEVTSDK
jgi:hypothetical protein